MYRQRLGDAVKEARMELDYRRIRSQNVPTYPFVQFQI